MLSCVEYGLSQFWKGPNIWRNSLWIEPLIWSVLQAIRAFDDLHQWIEQEQVMGAPGDHHFDCVDLHSTMLVTVVDHGSSWGLLIIWVGTGFTTCEYIAQARFSPWQPNLIFTQPRQAWAHNLLYSLTVWPTSPLQLKRAPVNRSTKSCLWKPLGFCSIKSYVDVATSI